jgi:hypothetical protein
LHSPHHRVVVLTGIKLALLADLEGVLAEEGVVDLD